MEENTWDLIKKIYEDNFGIKGNIVDYVAVNDILLQCVSGMSNEKICFTLDVEPVYLTKVLFNFLGFMGWARDLDISPWHIYNRSAGSKLVFEKKIGDLTNLLNDDIIELAFRVCAIYASIRKDMESFYEHS